MGLGLALGAMAVTTAIEGDSQILAAVQALIDMTTESGRPAARDGAHHLELLEPKPAAMSLDKWPAQRAEDIGHLHGGPVHSFFFRRDRFLNGVIGVSFDPYYIVGLPGWECLRVASVAAATSLCAGHVRQFGGESPLTNLMEVKV